MIRFAVNLVAMLALALCNLHSPAMAHFDAHDDHHASITAPDETGVAEADLDHHGATPDSDLDHGMAAANDHHAPPAIAISNSSFEPQVGASSFAYLASDAANLLSWSTAPPIEPPTA